MAELPMPMADVPHCWAVAALRTLETPRWEVTLARLFGRRFTGEDSGKTIVGYEWRGKLYMTDFH